MAILLIIAGLACIGASAAHGYLGQTKLIEPAAFESRQAKLLVSGIWQFSTIAWIASGIVIAASPWLFARERVLFNVSLACMPIIYGIVMNAAVTRGRHFGWKLYSGIVLTAIYGAAFISNT